MSIKHKSRFPQTTLLAKSIVLALLLLSILADCASARDLIKSYEVEKQVYDICTKSRRLIKSEQFDQAIPLLKKAASYDRTSYSADVHLNLSVCYQRLKRYNEALSEAKKALQFDPSSESATHNIALCYSHLDNFEQCNTYLDQYIKTTDNSQDKAKALKLKREMTAYTNLKAAEKQIAKGNDSNAIKLLETAINCDPTKSSGAAHGSLAFALRRSGKSEKAIEESRKTLKYNPEDKNTIYNLAIAYQDIARFNDAISWLNRYMSLEEDAQRRESAAQFLASLKEDAKQFKEADNEAPDYYNQLKEKNSTRVWPAEKMPLKVFIDPGKNVKGYQPVFRSFIIRSLDTWCEASGKKINYQLVNSKSEGDIKIIWTDKTLESRKNDHRLKAGITGLNFNNGAIADTLVAIRTTECFEPDKNVPAGQCASVCIHEIGHSLGLGHSTLVYDVMYFRSSTKQKDKPSKRDRATLARLYARHPIVAFAPKDAPLPKGERIKFLPPPTFSPPPLPDTKKVAPPIFLPPPLAKKLTPPLFIPPALKKKPAPPTFIPPALKQTPKKKDGAKKHVAPPLFLPPPAR